MSLGRDAATTRPDRRSGTASLLDGSGRSTRRHAPAAAMARAPSRADAGGPPGHDEPAAAMARADKRDGSGATPGRLARAVASTRRTPLSASFNPPRTAF